MDKVAVILPGGDYSTEGVLLASGKELAREYGYRLVEIAYGPGVSAGAEDPKQEKFYVRMLKDEVLEKVYGALSEEFPQDTKLVFIAKGIGCAFASAFQKEYEIEADNLYFCPIESAFSFGVLGKGCVFYGKKDKRFPKRMLRERCQHFEIPLFLFDGADQNLEIPPDGVTPDTLAYVKKICAFALEHKEEALWKRCDNEPGDDTGRENVDDIIQERWNEILSYIKVLSTVKSVEGMSEIDSVTALCVEIADILKDGVISDKVRDEMLSTIETKDYFTGQGCRVAMEELRIVLMDVE